MIYEMDPRDVAQQRAWRKRRRGRNIAMLAGLLAYGIVFGLIVWGLTE